MLILNLTLTKLYIYSSSVAGTRTIFRRNKDELYSFVELCAGEANDAEIEKYAEQNRYGYHFENGSGEQTQANGQVNANVGQTLLFHVDQLGLFTGYVRLAVDAQTRPMSQCSHGRSAHPLVNVRKRVFLFHLKIFLF
jgi:hypothetical protein